MTYWNKITLAGVVACVTLFASCSDDILTDDGCEEEGNAPFGYINVGASIGDTEMTTRATVIPDKTGHYYAETVDWLKGALKAGVNITYSNIDSETGERVFENERVGILKWDGVAETNSSTKANYTFHYKNGDAETDNLAQWNDNGQHYFEGQYVPVEISSTSETITAQNLTSDQSSDVDTKYLNNSSSSNSSSSSSSGTVGNYNLLSYYIGMPPSYKVRATVDQIMLPFKHRLARVIAYVLIDDMLEAKLKDYEEGNKTAGLSFSNVKVLERVKEETVTVGSGSNAATITQYTPIWKGGYSGEFGNAEREKSARTVIPHFLDEIHACVKSDGSAAASDNDAKNFFIVYINTKTEKKVHPRESTWLSIHNEFRSAGGATGTNAMTSEQEATAENSTGYRRQMYKRVPIYDIIVRPTYNTSYDNVMYDEEGYYKMANGVKAVDIEKRNKIYNQNNSIQFDLELNTGLKYSKVFTFDLNANQQTVVYLRIDREGISYDESSYELWNEERSRDGYYGVDNEEGHNLSVVGSSWQRAFMNGNDPKLNVTDGSNYGDKDNQYHDNNTDDGQYVSDTKWVMEFAKAGVGGSRQGDYFMLDKDITIDMRLLPENFIFAGHLDGKGHKITLSNCGVEGIEKYEAATENASFYAGDLFKQNSKSTADNKYEAFTAPTLYKFEPNGVIEDMDDANLDNPSTDGNIEDMDDGGMNNSGNGNIEEMGGEELNNSESGNIENMEEGELKNSEGGGSIEDMEQEDLSSTRAGSANKSGKNGNTRADGENTTESMFRELTEDEKNDLKLKDLKRTESVMYYVKNNDNTFSRYYLTNKEIDKFYKKIEGTYTSASTLFAGLNGTYEGNQGEYNLHLEKDNKGATHLVPVVGYRGEILNTMLTNQTFFPTEGTVYNGLDLNKSGATVTGYIFNCWEKDASGNWKKVENIVPIP